jgi:hypothetical protein
MAIALRHAGWSIRGRSRHRCTNQVRDDLPPDELELLHASLAGGTQPSTAAIRRLVSVTMSRLGSPR